MTLKLYFDHTKGIRGRLCLAYFEPDGAGKEMVVDQEVILKHPHFLRLRMWLAVNRMKRRQRKIAKFLENYNKRNAISSPALPGES
mgnify:CR=1 FL=1